MERTGLKRQPGREQVMGWGRSEASKASAEGRRAAKKSETGLKTDDGKSIIKKEDIVIGKSVGAKAKNYDVKLPDGTYSKLVEGSTITDIEVFAGKGSKNELRVKHHLVNNYGGKAENWQHTKGRGFVEYQGEAKKAVLHWFEEDEVGIVEMFVKGWSKK